MGNDAEVLLAHTAPVRHGGGAGGRREALQRFRSKSPFAVHPTRLHQHVAHVPPTRVEMNCPATLQAVAVFNHLCNGWSPLSHGTRAVSRRSSALQVPAISTHLGCWGRYSLLGLTQVRWTNLPSRAS